MQLMDNQKVEIEKELEKLSKFMVENKDKQEELALYEYLNAQNLLTDSEKSKMKKIAKEIIPTIQKINSLKQTYSQLFGQSLTK